jgi:hypothetical protein
MVDVKGVGKRFSGKYYVTSTTHRYSGMEGYTTSFVVGGRKPNTLFELTGGGQSPGPSSAGIQGVVVGVVTNLEDPDNLGRIKVKFPWLNDGQAEVESFWCRMASPGASAEYGIMWLPEVNDEVLVAFDSGGSAPSRAHSPGTRVLAVRASARLGAEARRSAPSVQVGAEQREPRVEPSAGVRCPASGLRTRERGPQPTCSIRRPSRCRSRSR